LHELGRAITVEKFKNPYNNNNVRKMQKEKMMALSESSFRLS
jgi:hypothetical protein